MVTVEPLLLLIALGLVMLYSMLLRDCPRMLFLQFVGMMSIAATQSIEHCPLSQIAIDNPNTQCFPWNSMKVSGYVIFDI